MLSKREFENLQKQLTECNCTYEEKDICAIRKGATGLSHSQFIHNARTKDLILNDVSAIAKVHPGDCFHVEFDGISRFSIIKNGEILVNSDFYEVEGCYQKNCDEFRNKLIDVMEKELGKS